MEQKYVKEAFDTNWVVPLGPNVNEFEHELEKFVNRIDHSSLLTPNSSLSKRVVALSAGTAAVHLALLACGVGPGDEVCVQSFTFCASSHPITYLGATPVFIDSERETWNRRQAERNEACFNCRGAKEEKTRSGLTDDHDFRWRSSRVLISRGCKYRYVVCNPGA